MSVLTPIFSSSSPEGSDILSTGPVTDGYVLTADGLGGSAWEAAAGGGWADMTEAVWTGGTQSEIADGASAIAFEFNTDNAYSTAGAKLASFKNNAVEKAWIDYTGGLNFTATASVVPSGNRVFITGEGKQYRFYFGQFYVSGGFEINSNTSPLSTTAPIYTLDGDEDTGLGFQAADAVNLIAGGVEGLRVTNAASVVTLTAPQGKLQSSVADGATAVAFALDTDATYSTAGANLLRLSNNTTTVLDFSYQGGIDHVNSGASTAAHSQSLNLNWVSTGTKTSSGAQSAVIGHTNAASGSQSISVGGYNNTASALYSVTIGGSNSTASGVGSLASGSNCQAPGQNALAFGISSKATIPSSLALGTATYGSQGNAQVLIVGASIATTNATPDVLEASGASLVIPAYSAWAYEFLVTAKDTTGEVAAWKVQGACKRDATTNAADVGTPTITEIANESTDAPQWSIAVAVNDTTDALDITVTGAAATTIRWQASGFISQVQH